MVGYSGKAKDWAQEKAELTAQQGGLVRMQRNLIQKLPFTSVGATHAHHYIIERDDLEIKGLFLTTSENHTAKEYFYICHVFEAKWIGT